MSNKFEFQTTMFKVSLFVLLAISSCHGFKIYLEHEDNWIDDEELYKEAKYQKLQWIYPGTKWCGTGDIAENENDLGSAAETDVCCREHDFCDDIIETGEKKHNLTNDSFYSKLNCKCDEKFYDCLKSGGTRTSHAVGHIYFNVLGTQCYRSDYPIVKCVRYHNFMKKRCEEYELNINKPKVWQWFDVPPF